jgi:SNF2 family DNA or RNA helicase
MSNDTAAPAAEIAEVQAAAEEAQGEGWRPPGFALVREALQRKGRDFRPYQVEGARWLGRERGAILADSPGLGKTIQLLALLEPEVGRAVVVGPKNAIPEWTAQVGEYRLILLHLL